MLQILTIFLILIIFAVAFIGAWLWFYQNGLFFFEKFYQLGQKAFEASDYKLAKTYFKKILFLSPTYSDVKLKLSICYLNLGKYEKAQTQLQQILSLSPKNIEALLTLAQTLIKLNKIEEAESTYKLALKENGKSVECNLGLGQLYLHKADPENALTYFETAKELSKEKNIKIEFYINRCLDELCDYKNKEQVEAIINNYIELEREGTAPEEFNFVVAKAYSRIGKIEQAAAYAKKSIEAGSRDVEPYRLMSLIQLLYKDYQSAKAVAAKALKLGPSDDETKNILSYIVCYQVENCNMSRCRKKYYEMLDKI